MNVDGLTRILDSEHAGFVDLLGKEIEMEKVERVYRALATAPAPTGNIMELSVLLKRLMKEEFGWGGYNIDYRVDTNRKGQVGLVFGNLDNNETFISIVPHGDQIMFNVDERGRGFPEGVEGKVSEGFRCVQVFPSHKNKMKSGQVWEASCYVYDPTKYTVDTWNHPGIKLLTKGVVRCVADPDVSLQPLVEGEYEKLLSSFSLYIKPEQMPSREDYLGWRMLQRNVRNMMGNSQPAVKQGEVSQFIFEYPKKVGEIPYDAVVIYDNESYYNSGHWPIIESACADDRAGICAALFASDLLFRYYKKGGINVEVVDGDEINVVGPKMLVNLHADEEGPSDRGVNWDDGGNFGTFDAVARNKVPASHAIIIDGHKEAGDTRLGNGAFFSYNPGGGYGSRTPQGLKAFLKLISQIAHIKKIRFNMNPEYVSRSSDVDLKQYQDIINVGFPIDHPHEMPESIHLDDVVDVARAVALISVAHAIKPIREQYLCMRHDRYRYHP